MLLVIKILVNTYVFKAFSIKNFELLYHWYLICCWKKIKRDESQENFMDFEEALVRLSNSAFQKHNDKKWYWYVALEQEHCQNYDMEVRVPLFALFCYSLKRVRRSSYLAEWIIWYVRLDKFCIDQYDHWNVKCEDCTRAYR